MFVYAAAQQRHAADAQISVSLIINGLCAPLMPGVGSRPLVA
jgi:hypothetical protein